MAATTYVTVALGLVVSALIARGLGPEDHGRYVYVIWLSGLLVTIGNHGLGITAIRFISEALGRERPDDASRIHGWLRYRQWFSLVGVLLVFLAAFPLLRPAGPQGNEFLLIAVVGISFLAKATHQFQVSVAKGHGRFHVESWSIMLMSVIYTGGVATLMLSQAPLTWYLLFFAAVSLGHVLVVAPMMRQAGVQADTRPCSPELVGRMRTHLWWTVVQVGAALLSNKTIETFLLNSLVGAAEVGYFAIASNLTRGGVELVASSLTGVLMPMMGHAYGAGGLQRVNVILSNAIRYGIFLGLILAGLGFLWSAFGIDLMYGKQYTAVVPVLQIMVVVGGLTLVESAFGALLTTTDNQRLRAISAVASVTISAACAFALVPLYGLMGAVWANALSRILVLLIVAGTVVYKLNVTLPWKAMGSLLLSAGCGSLAALLLLCLSYTPLMQFIAGIIYVLVFVTATVLIGGWHAKDVSLLLTLAERKPRQLGWLAPHLRNWMTRLPE